MNYSININYLLSGDVTPLDPKDYILSTTTIPATIEEGESVSLTFKADGMYFVLQGKKGVTVKGATSS
jgi:hypothetical protein